MSVHKAAGRQLFFCKWREDGKEKRRYFKTEQEALAYETERIQAVSQEEDRLTLGELVMLYFRSNPDKHLKTKKNIVHFLAGYDKDNAHQTGPGEFLRDKYADSLNRQDLERMREALRGPRLWQQHNQ